MQKCIVSVHISTAVQVFYLYLLSDCACSQVVVLTVHPVIQNNRTVLLDTISTLIVLVRQ